MKTSPAAPARPSTASRARLWRLAATGLVAPVVALAACSGGSTGTADSASPAGTAAPSTGAATSSAAAPTPSTTSAALPVDRQVGTNMRATITDPDLGHTITATSVIRHFAWPAGRPVSAKQFEIVGVWVTLQAGSRYSASIDPSMLTLVAANPAQTVMPTTEFANQWKATQLKAAARSQTTKGWVFFKVDRGTTNSLKLVFNRPAYEVSTTGRSFPAKTFSAVLVK